MVWSENHDTAKLPRELFVRFFQEIQIYNLTTTRCGSIRMKIDDFEDRKTVWLQDRSYASHFWCRHSDTSLNSLQSETPKGISVTYYY